jgi:hypothetical protein
VEWSREGVERVPLLCAPFERKDFVGLDMESRNNRQGLLLYISCISVLRIRIRNLIAAGAGYTYKLGITDPIPVSAPDPLFLIYQRFEEI